MGEIGCFPIPSCRNFLRFLYTQSFNSFLTMVWSIKLSWTLVCCIFFLAFVSSKISRKPAQIWSTKRRLFVTDAKNNQILACDGNTGTIFFRLPLETPGEYPMGLSFVDAPYLSSDQDSARLLAVATKTGLKLYRIMHIRKPGGTDGYLQLRHRETWTDLGLSENIWAAALAAPHRPHDDEDSKPEEIGDLFVALPSTKQIVRLFPAERRAQVIVNPSRTVADPPIPVDIGFGPEDFKMYVTDYQHGRVLQYDQGGELLGTFIDNVPEVTSITFFHCRNPVLFVASQNRVLRYNGTTGDFIDEFISPGDGGLTEPIIIRISPVDGDLYVSNKAGNILKFDSLTGAFQRVFLEVDDPAFFDWDLEIGACPIPGPGSSWEVPPARELTDNEKHFINSKTGR